MDTTFAIVGTAGRQEDANRLSKEHFEAMMECARLLLQQFHESDYGVDTLVSGGAAWADHVAVRLFLAKEVPKLKLFLPTKYDAQKHMFDVTPLNNWERNKNRSTGEIANGLHAKFTRKVGFDSLTDLALAMDAGAEVGVAKGFQARNWLVAQSDIILAMTFGDREWLKEGGTADTMKTYLRRVEKLGFFDKSFHYDLNSGEIFVGARVRTEAKAAIS